MPKLENKTALITGAGAGIGRATALLFAAEGARIAVVERNAEAGEETARLVQAQGGQALFIPTDVSEPDQVEAAVAQTVHAVRVAARPDIAWRQWVEQAPSFVASYRHSRIAHPALVNRP